MTRALAAYAAVAEPASPAPLAGHVVHVVGALAFFVLTIGGVALSERTQRVRRTQRVGRGEPHTGRRSFLLPVIAVAGAGAAAVHYVVMPEHFAASTLYGVFFAVTATVQLEYSVLLLLRPSRVLVATGVAGNLAMLALWLMTRTVGIPFGPAAGSIEGFGGLDILASTFETVVVVAGAMALMRKPLSTRSVIRTLASPQVAMMILGTAVAVTATAYLAPPS